MAPIKGSPSQSHLSTNHTFTFFSLVCKLLGTHIFLPVIGTIPSIPIPIRFANFGIELTPNSNSSLGIGATTPTPIQRNWGDSKGFQCLFWNQLKKLKKHVNQVSLAVFLNYQWHLDGEREIQTCGIPWNPPNSVEFGVGVDPPIPSMELELGHSKNQFQRIGIGVWNCELTPILFQWLAPGGRWVSPKSMAIWYQQWRQTRGRGRGEKMPIFRCT